MVVTSRAEEFRQLARECLDGARAVQNEDGRTALLQMAQVWLRLADEQADATEQLGERAPPPTTETAQPPAQQQTRPKDDDKKD
jgi:hypothetical protein